MNKVKGNIKVNVINAPTFGITKKDVLNDLAMLTGATIINEDLGDDLDLISAEKLGECVKSVTSDQETIIQIKETPTEVDDVINEIKKQLETEKSPAQVIRLEKTSCTFIC